MQKKDQQQALARTINLPLLALYGLGTILGAGIYVLVGKVAGLAGMLAPLAFLVAALIALFTALSYAQLVALFPKSAGEAVYVLKGLKRQTLATVVGWLVVMTGIVSSATLVNGFIGYLGVFVTLPHWLGVVLVVACLGAVAAYGIRESMWLSAIMTLVEIGGLIIVIIFGGDHLLTADYAFSDYFIPTSFSQLGGVLSAAFLAFYAFIGFEDMVNVAEEVKEPGKTIPKGIFIAVVVSTFLYILITLIAINALPLNQLAASDAPLSLILEGEESGAANTVAFISLFAIINGVLIQIIMASRVLYGMVAQRSAPAIFGWVSPLTHTPLVATLMVMLAVIVFALWLPVMQLAKITSFIILLVFCLINYSLYQLHNNPDYCDTHWLRSYPRLALLLCLFLLFAEILV